MNRTLTILFAAALFAPVPAYAQQAVPTPVTYLVQFNQAATSTERAAWLSDTGATLVAWIPQINVAEITLDPDRISATDADMSIVNFLEPDAIVTGQHLVTDTAFLDHNDGYGPRTVKVLPSWNVTSGISTTIVAILDTGINAAHPEFAGRIVPGYDFINDDDDPTDDSGHGTRVAGVIGAALDGTGIVGMCPQCCIMPVKVLDKETIGTWGSAVKGIVFAVDHGARVINLSLGAHVGSPIIDCAIEYARAHNVVVVAAAGNYNNPEPIYPAAIPYVIAVTATDDRDDRWESSSYGDHVDVAAPGCSIYSTNYGNTYAAMSGTSMAAPFVSGLAALVMSRQPTLSGEEVGALITGNVTDLGEPGWDAYFGFGRIDAYRTMVAANNNVEPEPDSPSGQVANELYLPSLIMGQR